MDIEQKQRLINDAFEVQKNAYAPYSSFHVGASLATIDGHIYTGANTENAAYPLSQCAEATAIGKMASDGHRGIKHIVIVSPNDDFCFPCGGCRQKIAEFANADTTVTMVTKSGGEKNVTVGELLPFAFSLKNA